MLVGNRQFLDSDGVIVNENTQILIDAASVDDMVRLSQMGVENLQRRSTLFVTEKHYIKWLIDRTFRATQSLISCVYLVMYLKEIRHLVKSIFHVYTTFSVAYQI